MITHIRMQNFKSWKDRGEVKLAPLTGFFGTNSSGKSSLLQMLLLLKQTAEHSDKDEVIYFGDEGSLVNLGNFREVIHGHDSEATLGLGFGCKLKEAFEIEITGRHPEGGLNDFPVLSITSHLTQTSDPTGWISGLNAFVMVLNLVISRK